MKGLHIDPFFLGYIIQVFLSAVRYFFEEIVPVHCSLSVKVFRYTNVCKATRVSQVWKIRFLGLALPNPPRISIARHSKELFSKDYLYGLYVYGILTPLYRILSLLYIY